MISNVLALALAKGVKSAIVKKASEEMEAGSYHIDQLVRVTGSVNKGEDYEQVVHMTVPHWQIIAVLLSKLNGVTIASVVKEVLEGKEDTGRETIIKKEAQEAADAIKNSGKQMVAGKVTTKLTFEPVQEFVGSKQEKEAVEDQEEVTA